MKLNPQCQLRNVAGENIILQRASTAGEEMKVIGFNDTAKMLWESLVQRDFELQDVAALLQHHYDIDDVTALRDATAWVDNLRLNHLLLDA